MEKQNWFRANRNRHTLQALAQANHPCTIYAWLDTQRIGNAVASIKVCAYEDRTGMMPICEPWIWQTYSTLQGAGLAFKRMAGRNPRNLVRVPVGKLIPGNGGNSCVRI